MNRLFDTSIFRGKGRCKVELITEPAPLAAAIVKAATRKG